MEIRNRTYQWTREEIDEFLEAFSPMFAPSAVVPAGIGREVIDQVWAYSRPIGEVVAHMAGRSWDDLAAELGDLLPFSPENLDSTDLHLLVAAVGNRFDVLCTSDRKLLALSQVGGVRIVAPSDLWRELADPS